MDLKNTTLYGAPLNLIDWTDTTWTIPIEVTTAHLDLSDQHGEVRDRLAPTQERMLHGVSVVILDRDGRVPSFEAMNRDLAIDAWELKLTVSQKVMLELPLATALRASDLPDELLIGRYDDDESATHPREVPLIPARRLEAMIHIGGTEKWCLRIQPHAAAPCPLPEVPSFTVRVEFRCLHKRPIA